MELDPDLLTMSCGLSSTLQKLHLLEKKLYKEVKVCLSLIQWFLQDSGVRSFFHNVHLTNHSIKHLLPHGNLLWRDLLPWACWSGLWWPSHHRLHMYLYSTLIYLFNCSSNIHTSVGNLIFKSKKWMALSHVFISKFCTLLCFYVTSELLHTEISYILFYYTRFLI